MQNLKNIQLIDIVSPPTQQQPNLPQLQVDKISNQGVTLQHGAQNILQSSFVTGILGKPGSGKSTLIEHFIKEQKLYAYKFERILYIGPTQYKNISRSLPIIQDQFNWRKSLDLKWIFDRISESNDWGCQNMLLIFDDVITYMKDGSQIRQCQQLFYNRRHLLKKGCISIMVTSQKWTSFPKFVRSGLTALIMFSVNKYQCESVWKQTSIGLSRSNLGFIVGQLKPYEYLYINFTNGKIFNSKWQQTA